MLTPYNNAELEALQKRWENSKAEFTITKAINENNLKMIVDNKTISCTITKMNHIDKALEEVERLMKEPNLTELQQSVLEHAKASLLKRKGMSNGLSKAKTNG